ncbi:class I adenylate-forming enzyme family protein [Pseudomonas sp. CT11-2]|uniref:class I adenylate-forming enzyme family protein n=1 Tax=Pseudomonas sp. CT11-2 TaxID=3243023 RepID=UPI0039B0F02D
MSVEHVVESLAECAFQATFADGLQMFYAARDRAPQAAAVHYFDTTLSYAQLDRQANALAAFWQAQGVVAGDRVGLFLQNVPQFVIGLIASWKLGAIAVSINPMNRARELSLLLEDSQARVLMCHDSLYHEVVAQLERRPDSLLLVVTGDQALQSRNDPRIFGVPSAPAGEGFTLSEITHSWANAEPVFAPIQGSDVATIVYTSGTTGLPKGVEHTHSNFAFNSEAFCNWAALGGGESILAMAPLFHVTGLVLHIGVAFACAAPLVLTARFHPEVFAEAVQTHQATFTIGAITAFIALLNADGVRSEQLASLSKIYSGGAPIPDAVVSAYRQKFGHDIRAVYGLTETTSVATAVPHDRLAACNEEGQQSVGLPIHATELRIANEQGEQLGTGSVGEILIRGPQVMRGYWQRPEATYEVMSDGFLRSGDVGYLDAEGWLFLVDRMKDVIIASGFKVWPREVEDVLYSHPDVREAAVVGVKDDYRGESVKAVVSLKAGAQVTPEQLMVFCKSRMAAYKYPRQIDICDDLPKTSSGKVMRKALRG